MTNRKEGAYTKKEELSKTQLNFLNFLKEYGWGKVEVTIVNGEPVGTKEIERTHRHDINN